MYENSIFTLNLRELDKWLISRFKHGFRKHQILERLNYDKKTIFFSNKELLDKYITIYNNYIFECKFCNSLLYFSYSFNKILTLDVIILLCICNLLSYFFPIFNDLTNSE